MCEWEKLNEFPKGAIGLCTEHVVAFAKSVISTGGDSRDIIKRAEKEILERGYPLTKKAEKTLKELKEYNKKHYGG